LLDAATDKNSVIFQKGSARPLIPHGRAHRRNLAYIKPPRRHRPLLPFDPDVKRL